MTGADNAAHRALATDQDRLDFAAIIAANEKGHHTWPARKMDNFDIVSGVIKELVCPALRATEMRRN
jgi:hypothetical protein